MNRPGRLQRGYGAVEPLLAAGSGGRRGRRQRGRGRYPARAGPEPTRVQPKSPRTQERAAGARAAYAEVALRRAVRHRGGSRERREGVAGRRRCVRIRSITAGSVMTATMRMASPHRGQRSGSTSKIRRSSSAQRRRTSGSAGGTASASTATGGCSSGPAVRRMPRVRFAYLAWHRQRSRDDEPTRSRPRPLPQPTVRWRAIDHWDTLSHNWPRRKN